MSVYIGCIARLSDTAPERNNKILDNIPKNRLRGKEATDHKYSFALLP